MDGFRNEKIEYAAFDFQKRNYVLFLPNKSENERAKMLSPYFSHQDVVLGLASRLVRLRSGSLVHDLDQDGDATGVEWC